MRRFPDMQGRKAMNTFCPVLVLQVIYKTL